MPASRPQNEYGEFYLELRKSGMGQLGHRELGGKVIEAAIALHRELGPGFVESVYENALCHELERRKILYERQKTVAVMYNGKQVGEHRLDLLVEEVLLVELKAVQALDDIFFAIGRSCLKAAGVEDGLILNFATMPLTVKRIGREWFGSS